MSAEIHEVTTSVLTPLVGRAMATVYVSKAALSMGKASSDDIESEDLPRMFDEIRTMMAPFTSRDLLDQALNDIQRKVGWL